MIEHFILESEQNLKRKSLQAVLEKIFKHAEIMDSVYDKGKLDTIFIDFNDHEVTVEYSVCVDESADTYHVTVNIEEDD